MKPPGLPLRSAMRPASVEMAISGGVREPMLTPIGRCTLLISARRDAELGERGHVRPLVPGIAHDADPARAGRQRVTQLDAELGPVMIGHDDVGLTAGMPVRPSASSKPSAAASLARSASGSISTGR